MKIPPSAGFLIAGLAIGILVGKGLERPAAESAENSGAATARTRAERPERASTSGAGSIHEIRRAAPTALPGLTRRSASIADPVEMRRHTTECLLHMTAENWREVVTSFDKLSKETGRDAAEEWKLALFRAGQVAGPEAIQTCLPDGLKRSSQESWSILYGWGSKDPRAALAWLKNAETSGHETNPQNYTAVIAGAALDHPEGALKLLAEIPPERRSGCAGHLVWNILQNGGADALDTVLQYASTLDSNDPNDSQFSSSLFREVGEKLLWKADHARDVNQACDVVLKLTRYGQDPTRTTYQALQKYRYYDMEAKLNLVETVNRSSPASGIDLPYLAAAVLGTMNNGNNDKTAVREWMRRNPESPLNSLIENRVADSP